MQVYHQIKFHGFLPGQAFIGQTLLQCVLIMVLRGDSRRLTSLLLNMGSRTPTVVWWHLGCVPGESHPGAISHHFRAPAALPLPPLPLT